METIGGLNDTLVKDVQVIPRLIQVPFSL